MLLRWGLRHLWGPGHLMKLTQQLASHVERAWPLRWECSGASVCVGGRLWSMRIREHLIKWLVCLFSKEVEWKVQFNRLSVWSEPHQSHSIWPIVMPGLWQTPEAVGTRLLNFPWLHNAGLDNDIMTNFTVGSAPRQKFAMQIAVLIGWIHQEYE